MNFIGSEVTWLGLSQRKHLARAELLTGSCGAAFIILGVLHEALFLGGSYLVICAYGISLVTRLGDKYAIW